MTDIRDYPEAYQDKTEDLSLVEKYRLAREQLIAENFALAVKVERLTQELRIAQGIINVCNSRSKEGLR